MISARGFFVHFLQDMIIAMNKLKLYVGCSLTQAPEEFRAKVESFKGKLRDEFDILDFIGLTNGTPAEVYHWDIQNCIAGCDIFVAITDLPAIGLGYELGTALEKYSKPTLAVAHTDANVSRMLLGIDHPMYEFKRYDGLDEVIAMVREKRAKHYPASAAQNEDEACDVCAV